ncbi:MAG: hypothetical protein FWD35_03395, partial [Oscillospiraceae bacterium]|nr:hypothetical protein [Oscillospiraceae bacterium]
MILNRDILHIRRGDGEYTPLEGLPTYEAVRPATMNDDDFNSMLNFFRKIIDETRYDGARYANISLMRYHMGNFCLAGGTVLFKVIEKKKGSGVPELYGFYTELSNARSMWLEIEKLCYLLTLEQPGSVESGEIDYAYLNSLGVNHVQNAQPIYRSNLEKMAKDFQSSSYPVSGILTCLPSEFYPNGVKRYDNGMHVEKTDAVIKKITLEFNEAQIREKIAECTQPLQGAVLVSIPYEDEDSKKGGLFGGKKKKAANERVINQWHYRYVDGAAQKEENCDFIKLDKPFEYSPLIDTFNSYIGKFGTNVDPLPDVDSAGIPQPKPPASEMPTATPGMPAAGGTPSAAAPPAPGNIRAVRPPKPTKQKSPPPPPIAAAPAGAAPVAPPPPQHSAAMPVAPPPTGKKGKPPPKVHPLLDSANERAAAPAPPKRQPQRHAPPPKPKRFEGKVHPLLESADERAAAPPPRRPVRSGAPIPPPPSPFAQQAPRYAPPPPSPFAPPPHAQQQPYAPIAPPPPLAPPPVAPPPPPPPAPAPPPPPPPPAPTPIAPPP